MNEILIEDIKEGDFLLTRGPETQKIFFDEVVVIEHNKDGNPYSIKATL